MRLSSLFFRARIYERSVLFMSKVKVISMSSDCEKCDASSVPA